MTNEPRLFGKRIAAPARRWRTQPIWAERNGGLGYATLAEPPAAVQ
jgi:hypothetical protein